MRLSPEETANFLKNLEFEMQKRWWSAKEVARKSGVNYVTLVSQINSYLPVQDHHVRAIAAAINHDYNYLIQLHTHKEFPSVTNAFIAEARYKGFSLELTSQITGISQTRLKHVIHAGLNKLNTDEIMRLQRIHYRNMQSFSLPVLAPFAAPDVNMVRLVTEKQLDILAENKSPLFYKQKAIKQLMFEQGVSVSKLSDRVGMSSWEFREEILGEARTRRFDGDLNRVQKQWQSVLMHLNVLPQVEDNLVVMGKYKLNTAQLKELQYCEYFLRSKANSSMVKSTVASMTEDELYRLYVSMKHAWANQSKEPFSQSTLSRIVQNASLKKIAMIGSITLASFVKSLPVAAAEALTDYSVLYYGDRAALAAAERNNFQALFYYAGSNLAKFALLIPESIYAAFQAPFDAPRDVIFSRNPLDLPLYIARRFIEAEGYSSEIVKDWKKMWILSKDVFKSGSHILDRIHALDQSDLYDRFESMQDDFELSTPTPKQSISNNVDNTHHDFILESLLNYPVSPLMEYAAHHMTEEIETQAEEEYTMFHQQTQGKKHQSTVQLPAGLVQDYADKAAELTAKVKQLQNEIFISKINSIAGDLHHLGMSGMNLATMAIEAGGHPRTWRGVAKVSQGLMALSSGMTSLAMAPELFSFGALAGGTGILLGVMMVGIGLMGEEEQEDSPLMEAILAIYQGLVDMENRLTTKINESMLVNIAFLTQINAKQDRLERIATISFKELHSKELIEICDAIRKEMLHEIELTDAKKMKYLQKLSTWIDLHSTSKIQTSMLRDSKEVSKCVEILSSDDFDLMAMLPFYMAQLNRLVASKAVSSLKIDELPNVALLTAVSEVYMTAVFRYNGTGNHAPLLTRTQSRLESIVKLIDSIKQDEEIVEVLFRQYEEARFHVGRALEKCRSDFTAREGVALELHLKPGLNNENLIQALDQLELRRLMLIHLCDLCHFQGEKQAHIINLESKRDILQRPADVVAKNAERIFALASYSTQVVMLAHSDKNAQLAEFKSALESGAAINAWDGNKTMNWHGPVGAFGQAVHLLIRDRPSEKEERIYSANMLHLLCKADNFEMNNPSHTAYGTWGREVRPITWAMNCGYFDLAVLLCANGYDISEAVPTPYCYPAMQHDYGNSFERARTGETECVIQRDLVREINTETSCTNKKALRKAYEFYKLAEAGFDPSPEGVNQYCVYMLVAILGDLRPLKLIGTMPANRINHPLTQSKLNLLMLAVLCGKEAVVARFIELGANLKAKGEFFPFEGPSQVLAMAKHRKFTNIVARLELALNQRPAIPVTGNLNETYRLWMTKNPNLPKLVASSSIADQLGEVVKKLMQTKESLIITTKVSEDLKNKRDEAASVNSEFDNLLEKIQKFQRRANDIYLLLIEHCKTTLPASLNVQDDLKDMLSSIESLKKLSMSAVNVDDDNHLDATLLKRLIEVLEEFIATSNIVDAKLKANSTYKLSNNVLVLINEGEKMLGLINKMKLLNASASSVFSGQTSAMFKPNNAAATTSNVDDDGPSIRKV